MVSQRTAITSDGKASEDALFECVPASIGACMLWLEGKQQWDDTINPDKLKDAAYGDAYTGGTSASAYVNTCKSMGFNLYDINPSDYAQAIATARAMLKYHPIIFTEVDPYVDMSLPQYAGWTHVCVWFADDGSGLTAMDPFIAQPVYKSYATWEGLLRSSQLWTVEKIMIPTGWTDDGTTLHSPNGVPIVLGFRQFVLNNNWAAENWALAPESGVNLLEASNPSLGGGSQQLFRWSMLGYTESRGVFQEWTGTELAYTRQQLATYYNEYKVARAAIALLQEQVKQVQQPTGIDPKTVTERLSAIGLAASNGNTAVQQLVNQPL